MRLIDADALNETLEKCKDNYRQFSYGDMNMCDAIDIAEQYVEYAPTVEAETVKHGYWATQHITSDGVAEELCSGCEEWSIGRNKRFCPNCGRWMDLEEQRNETD